MVSFTENDIRFHSKHRKRFGRWGIVISKSWLFSHGGERVLYLDDAGPLFESLEAVFRVGEADLESKIKYPDDSAWTMAYTNKAVAGGVAGSVLWANLLQIYEYLEPIASSYQNEWRVVNQQPYYGFAATTEEIIKNVSPPQGWAKMLNVLKFEPEDVTAIVCPITEIRGIRKKLPERYRRHKILPYFGW